MKKTLMAFCFCAVAEAHAGLLPVVETDPAAAGVPQSMMADDGLGAHRMLIQPFLGPKRVLLVIGNWSDGSGPDVAKVRSQVFSADPRSLRSYVRAASGGKLELNEYRTLVADFGARPAGACASDDMRARAEKAMAAAGISDRDYDDHHIVVSCQGGANAKVLGRTALFFGVGRTSHAWLHEYGHNLGVHHPTTYVRCPQSGTAVHAPAGCAVSAAVDSGDPVGGGSGLYPAITRAFAGWLDTGQFAEITRSGLYVLGALGSPGPNLYTIRVPGKDRYLTLEYRQPHPLYDFASSDNRSNGLWIRYSQVAHGITSVQLNANPQDDSLQSPALVAGKTLVDMQSGVSITTCRTGKDGAVFAVALDGDVLPSCTATPMPSVVTLPAAGSLVPTTPVIAGTGVPGARVTVVESFKPGNVLGTTQVDAHGRWQLVPDKPLPSGTLSISSRQSLGDKVSPWSDNRHFVSTEMALSTPVITAPTSNAGTSRFPLVSGTAWPGATVQLVKAHDSSTVYGRAVADTDGRWSIKVVRPLPEGTASVSARQMLAGRTSRWSANQGFTVSHAVTAPVVALPLANARVSRKDIRVSGTATAGSQVVVVRQGRPQDLLGSATADEAGNWQVRLSSDLAPGRLGIASRTWDNGLVSSWSTNRAFTIVE